MAGQLGIFVYKDDNATKYLVTLDNSNANITGSGFTAATQTEKDTLPALPKTLKMRYVNCKEPTTGSKRRIYVGSLTGTLWTHAQTTASLMVYTGPDIGTYVPFDVKSRVGETLRWQ